MTDDELIRRLRRSFQEQAGAIQPSPGQTPTGDTGPVGVGAGAPPTPPLLIQGGGADQERRTQEYQLTTGPVPIVGRIGKTARHAPVLIGAGAVAAAAAVIATVIGLSNRNPAVRTVPAGPSTTSGSVTPATSVRPAAPTTASTAPTLPPARPVPSGFQPFSVTFVSADEGWVLGASPAHRAVLAATTDGGRTWSEANAPDINYVNQFPPFNVRFADQLDGWIYTNPYNQPTELWSTHDGGLTWRSVPVPLTGGTIGDLEAAAGQADMVVYGTCPAREAGCQGQFEVEILTSPATVDNWVPSPDRPSAGAGPELSPTLTTWGNHGWLVDNNRTVVSGARLAPGSGWQAWTPACSQADGAGVLAAASSTDLTAVCAEGVWGTPDQGTSAGHNWLFHSTDGGSTFTSVGQVPGNNPQSLTVAPGHSQTIVMADSQLGLQASFDGGHTWSTALPGLTNGALASPGGWYGFVGFTTATQGVAIRYKSVPTLFMTRDGGHTWSPVSF
jgi:hypothetical protein